MDLDLIELVCVWVSVQWRTKMVPVMCTVQTYASGIAVDSFRDFLLDKT